MGFWEISLETANRIYAWGWRLSVGGAVVTAIGVLLLMWGTRVRDHDFETQVATLHGRAADAEKVSKQLDLELAKLRLPRDINFETFKHEMATIPTGFVQVWYGPGTDSSWLAQRIAAAFGSQGWKLIESPSPVKPDDSLLCKTAPPLECMGGNSFLVTVVTRPSLPDEESAVKQRLMNALGVALGTGMFGGEHVSVPIWTFRIMVGPRS
jgi:hypothetical protein